MNIFTRNLLIVATIMLFLVGCNKSTKKIKIINEYNEAFVNLHLGEIDFGYVDPGEETDFEKINTGTFALIGNTPSGVDLNMHITIHPDIEDDSYVLTITPRKTVKLKHD